MSCSAWPETTDDDTSRSSPRLYKYRPNAFHHVVFSTKRRKKVLVPPIKERVHYWIEHQIREHNIDVREFNTWLNHGHMLIFVRAGEDLSDHVQAIKGGCARHLFRELPDLKWQMDENHLWARRFWAEEVPPNNIEAVRNYIRNQKAVHLRRLGWQPVPAWERWIDLD